MSSSYGNLIFDVTGDGAGVQVFQPFRNEQGDASLATEPGVADGDQQLTLEFSMFDPGQLYQFSIDVDDQLAQSDLGQIRVSGSEMTGASLLFTIVNKDSGELVEITGEFNNDNQVLLESGDC